MTPGGVAEACIEGVMATLAGLAILGGRVSLDQRYALAWADTFRAVIKRAKLRGQ